MATIIHFGRRQMVRGKEDWTHPFCTAYGRKDHRVRLKPGANLVPDEAAKALLQDETFKADLAAGIVRVQEAKGKVAAQQAEQDTLAEFEKIPQAQILKVIPDMLDTSLLTRISKEDRRSQVVGAARRRLDEILGPEAGQGDGTGG